MIEDDNHDEDCDENGDGEDGGDVALCASKEEVKDDEMSDDEDDLDDDYWDELYKSVCQSFLERGKTKWIFCACFFAFTRQVSC